jgi:hypothetical protein
MLEKQLKESNHTKKQGFVSQSSPPTKEEKFGKIAPNWEVSLHLALNLRPLQKLAP